MKITENSTVSLSLIIAVVGAVASVLMSCQMSASKPDDDKGFREQVLQRLTRIETILEKNK